MSLLPFCLKSIDEAGEIVVVLFVKLLELRDEGFVGGEGIEARVGERG